MNNLKQYIQEKLIINKDSKLKSYCKIDIDDKLIMEENDIAKIKEFVDSLKIKPFVMTNKFYLDENVKIVSDEYYLFLFFFDNYLETNIFDVFPQSKDDKIIGIRFNYYHGKYNAHICVGNHGWKFYYDDSLNIDYIIFKVKQTIKKDFPEYIE